MMKITVLGAGAVGSMFGGLLKHHAPEMDVLLTARGSHRDAIRRQGHVSLLGPWGRRQVPVNLADRPRDIENSDYVLMTVKSQSTEDAIREAAPHLGEATVISIQNGINQQVLRRFVRPQRLIMGMTATNMAIPEPGTVSLQRSGPTVIGGDEVASTRIAEATKLLLGSGLPVAASTDILGVQYNKLVINTLGYASVLSASNFIAEGILNRSWRRAVGIPLLGESLSVLQRAGIRVARTPGVSDAYRLTRLLGALEVPLLDTTIRLAIGRRVRRRPIVFSLCQDLLRGKKTEIDFVNGEIVRLAKEHGGDCPYNARVVEMVHRLEQRGDGSFFSPEEVISRFENIG